MLIEVILNRANLESAQAEVSNFTGAQLQGASLDFAGRRGASFLLAQLQGASLKFAQLQGASLIAARLQGATLHRADLQGAFLVRAQLQGASLAFAGREGASLEYAQLQGASLEYAQLSGALFDSAGLQGASLVNVMLCQAASFRNVFVWRAKIGLSERGSLAGRRELQNWIWKDVMVTNPETGPKKLCYDSYDSRPEDEEPEDEDKNKICAWTADTFEERKRLITNQVPEGELREDAMERIDSTLDPNNVLEGEASMAENWTNLERSSPKRDAYEKSLAEQWRMTGCNAEGAPYVIRARLARVNVYAPSVRSNPANLAFASALGYNRNFSISPFIRASPGVAKLAAAFLAPDCAGARGLTNDEIEDLKELAARAASQAPKS